MAASAASARRGAAAAATSASNIARLLGAREDMPSGVPLHAEQERAAGILDRLDGAVGRGGHRAQPGAEPVGGLVVEGVDRERDAAGEAGEQESAAR